MERNRELFEKIAAQIEETPDRYNQNEWRDTNNTCGTAYCVAGWAVALAKGEDWFEENESSTTVVETFRMDGSSMLTTEPYVPSALIMDTAVEELGIDDEEADVLFAGTWMHEQPIGDVAGALRDIANGRSIQEQM